MSWHLVVRDEGPTAFTGLENGSWAVRAALPTLEELRAQKLADLAALRWEKETGGTKSNLPLDIVLRAWQAPLRTFSLNFDYMIVPRSVVQLIICDF